MNRQPFFTEALPCESCGHPVQSREWNPEYELWIGTECSCQAPDQPLPDCLIPVYEAAQTLDHLRELKAAHQSICPVCGPVQLPRKPAAAETDSERLKREAA